MTIGLMTGMFGDYDIPNALEIDHGFDRAVFVTDDKSLHVPGWEMLYIDWPTFHPRVKSKIPKIMAHDYMQTDQTVWIDSSMKLVSPDFVNVARDVLEESDIVMWSHKASGRTDAYQEAEFCFDLPKYRDQPLREQIEYYRKMGYPENYGLWQTGTLARNNTGRNDEFAKLWIKEIMRWSYQDQVSFSYVAWLLETKPETWDDGTKPWWLNPWLKFTGHKREET